MRASLKRERNGIPKLQVLVAAATALFLASKVEESSRKMRELVLAFCRVAQKNPNLVIDEQSKDFWRWRDSILYNEDVFLETLCFDLTVESPHRYVYDMLRFYGLDQNKRVRNAAWSFVTDSSQTQLCLLANSRTIAVASLYAACRHCDIALADDAKGRPWWDAQRVRLRDVRKAVDFMCANYEAANKLNGNGTGLNAGPEGERSIYAGLGTPADGGINGWDSTRLKEDASGGEARTPLVDRIASERRGSNASSVGVKRDREPGAHANEARNHGIERADAESKRPRLELASALNGDAERIAAESGRGRDPKHREEALRVEHSNQQEVENAKAVEQDRAAAAGIADPTQPAVEHSAAKQAAANNGDQISSMTAAANLESNTEGAKKLEISSDAGDPLLDKTAHENGSEEGEVEE